MAKQKKDRNKPRGGKAFERQIKTQFKKGHKTNKGKEFGQTDPQQKEVVTLTRAMVTRYISQYIGASVTELDKVCKSPTAPMIERIVCRIILVSDRKADQHKLEFLLNRAVGKVKDEVEFSGIDPYADLTDEQLLAKRQVLAEKNLETLRMMNRAIEVTKPNEITTPEPTPSDDSSTKTEGTAS